MKVYSAECISGEPTGFCGIFSTMNLAISEIIHRNSFRTDIPNIWDYNNEAKVVYEGNDDYDYTEFHIAEYELNKWED